MLRPNLSHQSILTPDDFNNKDALCTRGFLHQWTRTPETFYTRSLFYTWFLHNFYFTRRHLHLKRFTSSQHILHQRLLDTRKILQEKPFATTAQQIFTPDDSYARSTLHQRVFTAEGFYPDPFTPNNFCTRNRLITTGNLLVHFFHKEPLRLPKIFDSYARSTSHQSVFTAEDFYIKPLLHETAVAPETIELDHKCFRTGTLYTKEFIDTWPPMNSRFCVVFVQKDLPGDSTDHCAASSDHLIPLKIILSKSSCPIIVWTMFCFLL